MLTGATLLLLTFAIKEARGGNFVVLKEGTPVTVELIEDFDAEALQSGDKVPMVVAEKVRNEGFVLIDAGAPVEATFTSGNNKTKNAGFIKISGVQAVDGQDVRLRATPEAPEAAEELPVIALAERSRMPGWTTFRVYLSESYFIED